MDIFITNNERISTNNESVLYVCVYAFCLNSKVGNYSADAHL